MGCLFSKQKENILQSKLIHREISDPYDYLFESTTDYTNPIHLNTAHKQKRLII